MERQGWTGVTLTRIDEVIGEERFVEELHNELKARQYKASPVRREYIPKANGETATTGNTGDQGSSRAGSGWC